MTLNELFLTACLTFLDTDEPADKSLALHHNDRKLSDPSKTLTEVGLQDKASLYLKSSSTSAPSRKHQSQPPQGKEKSSKSRRTNNTNILSTAMETLAQNQSGSSSTPKSAVPLFDFGSIKVDSSKTKDKPVEDLETLQLTQSEKLQYQQYYNFLKMPGASYMLAPLYQSDPDLHEAVQKSDLKNFLEIHRKRKIAQKKREKEVFGVIANPDSAESKKYLAKVNKTEAVYENFQQAMEHTPEVFGNVFMLYINCKVNGKETKAFVDSGAQKTIISSKWCQHCDLEGLLDERFSGMAKGVGFQKINGRVHYAMMEIEGKFFSTSFDVLEGQDIDILIGLDFLKRHRACIDLGQNQLVFPDENLKTRFLNENELPQSSVTKQNEAADQKAAASSVMEDENFERNVKKMVEMGYDENVCKETLVQAGGNFELAVQNLLGAMQ